MDYSVTCYLSPRVSTCKYLPYLPTEPLFAPLQLSNLLRRTEDGLLKRNIGLRPLPGMCPRHPHIRTFFTIKNWKFWAGLNLKAEADLLCSSSAGPPLCMTFVLAISFVIYFLFTPYSLSHSINSYFVPRTRLSLLHTLCIR